MRVWRLNESAPPPGLVLEEIPKPQPGPGEILVRIRAAGVIPTELQWYPTTHTSTGDKRLNPVPCHEFAGVIDAIGDDANGPKVGDEIYGMNDWYAAGAAAEFCLARPVWIAKKPYQLSFAQAASVPISALTAWQGLFDHGKLQKGQTVLIHGGAGGVGAFAVQFARRQGARVITTASARNREFLQALGAQTVIDYHTEDFTQTARGIDLVFDTVGGKALERSWNVLAPAGRLVTVASDLPDDERTKKAFFIVEPSREQLSEVAVLLDAGEIQTAVDAEVPFAQANDSFAKNNIKRAGRGKVVIVMN